MITKILILLSVAFISFLIGKYFSTKTKKNTENNYIREVKEEIKEEVKEEVKKEVNIDEIVKETIRKCRGYNIRNSIDSLLQNYQLSKENTNKAIKKLFEVVELILIEEIISIKNANLLLPAQETIKDKVKTQQNTKISQDDLNIIGNNYGLDIISHLFVDKNFDDFNSLDKLSKAWESCIEQESYDCLFNYFNSEDGKKHWNNPEAKHLIDVIITYFDDEDESQAKMSTEFNNHFKVELKLHRLINGIDIDDFVKEMKKMSDNDLRKFFSVGAISHGDGDDDDENREFELLNNEPALFFIWLQETPEIYSDYIFSYLAWNNILPERFKKDERYETSMNQLKNCKTEKPAFNEVDGKLSIYLEFIKEQVDTGDFLDFCIDNEKYVPLSFWENIDDKDIINDNNEYISNFALYGYIKSGLLLNSESFMEVLGNDLIESAQIYFEQNHKKFV